MRREVLMKAADSAGDAAGFVQKDFFEFHLYTLGRKTTLPNNSTKQIELFDQAKQIPAKKVLLYYGAVQPYFYPSPYTDRNMGIEMNKKVDVYLEFKNDKQFGLGVPLPAGRLRVSQLDKADGSLEFIGEDKIDHTPKDEQVRVKLGSAFDVVGERRQVELQRRHRRQVDGRGNRSEAAQPQVAAGRCGGEGKSLPLEQLENPDADAQVRQGRRAHHQLPREGGEGRRDGRSLPGALHLVARRCRVGIVREMPASADRYTVLPGGKVGTTRPASPAPLPTPKPTRLRAAPKACKPRRFRRIQALIVASTSTRQGSTQ